MTEPIGPYARVAAFGHQLIAIHLSLRDSLAELRDDIEAHLAGTGEPPRELRNHCVAFCAALGAHHVAEDTVAFRLLAEHHPELRPVLDELQRDHVVVAGILRRLDDIVGGLAGRTVLREDEMAGIRAELDGLAAVLESHFVYEEKKIADRLNALNADGETTESLLGISP